jgi:cyclophilin family peptidyl-prolyl cis-trans isomerase
MSVAGWLVMAAAAACQAQVPVIEGRPDAAKARAEFDAARQAQKDLVGELSILQAEFQRPNADLKAIDEKFKVARAKIPAVKDRLETAAFAMALTQPTDKVARDVCGAVIDARRRSEDFNAVLQMATILDKAGAADSRVDMMASQAAMVLSQLDDAATWLAKAAQHGADKAQIADLEEAIRVERPKVEEEMARRKADAEADDRPRVKITTTKGPIVVELFEDEAPNTVANFISLVEKGFYDGTRFHRVIGGFMAQGGDPTGTGGGGPGHAIDCECELPNARKHFIGSLSMAHAGKNTGGSQFFLTFRPTEHLDGKHTVFGRVIEGLDVLPKLTRTQNAKGEPIDDVKTDEIVKAEVLRKRDHAYVPETKPDRKKG